MPIEVEARDGVGTAFRLGEWLVEPSLNRISKDDTSTQLELKVMGVLLCLAERAGEVVTRQKIIDEVWATEYIADNTLTHAITGIRNALGDDAREPRYIETIPRRGYRLVAELMPLIADPEDDRTIPVRPRSRLRPAAWAAALGLLGLVLGYALIAWQQPSSATSATEFDPHRIAVVPFSDRTGDPSLHALVDLTADRLTQGFAELDELEVVPASVVRAASAGVKPAHLAHQVASATSAGLVLTGAWDALGNRLELQATLEDTVNHEIVRAFEPIPATRVAPDEAVGMLRDWALMAVQDHLYPGLAFGAGKHFPEYEVYRRYRLWFETMGIGNTTLEEVLELDPDWARVRIAGCLAHFFGGSLTYAEKILEPIEDDDQLNVHQEAIVRGLRNCLEGRWVDAYVEFNAALERGHDDYLTRMVLLAVAKNANRPELALEHFEQLGEPPLAVANDFSYRFAIDACHMLGRYEQELELVRQLGRYSRTSWFGEARALVALGRLDEIEALVSEAQHNHPTSAGELMLRAARFLLGHGYREEGIAMAERTVEWYSTSSLQDQKSENCRICIAESLVVAGHAAEAQAIYRELLQEDPSRIGWLEGIGVTAARLDDRSTAEEMMVRIEAVDDSNAIPRLKFSARARIAAELCDREEALKLLRDAIANGYAGWIGLHNGFGCLTNDPEFQEVVQPKG